MQQYSVHNADAYLLVTRRALEECSSIDAELAVLLARILMLEAAILADLKRLASYPIDDERGFLRSSDPDGAAELYGAIGQLMEAAEVTGGEVIERVAKLHPVSPKGMWDRYRLALSIIRGV
ncbi:MAG: hypothetical protein ABS41_12510 [Arenimonas sp. SCN 70-307]|nr:MAG: hypothetical protein ABS41_12510 [Arenimonas sp. SCN 70-307]